MIIDTVTPPKQPAENLPITIDFTANLPAAGTVTDCVVTSRIAETGVDSTATIINGARTISSPNVTQFVHAGTNGQNHIVTFHATFSDTRQIDDEVYLPIVEF